MSRNLMLLFIKLFPYITLLIFCHSVPHITSAPGSSSSCAHAQVIRVAHSGSRSSCMVDLGFVGFLLSLLCFLRFPSGGLFCLRIFCCIRFYPSFGLFFGSPVGCVLGFLRFSCRICIGDLFRGFSCSLILSLAWMLLPLVWHCIVFCSVYPCILV